MKKQKNKNKHTTKSAGNLLQKGRLEITRSGMGYVIVENEAGDVMVKPGDFNTA